MVSNYESCNSRIFKQAIERGIDVQDKKDENDNGDKTFKIRL